MGMSLEAIGAIVDRPGRGAEVHPPVLEPPRRGGGRYGQTAVTSLLFPGSASGITRSGVAQLADALGC